MAPNNCINTFRSLMGIVDITNTHNNTCRFLFLHASYGCIRLPQLFRTLLCILSGESCQWLIRPYKFLSNSLMSYLDRPLLNRPSSSGAPHRYVPSVHVNRRTLREVVIIGRYFSSRLMVLISLPSNRHCFRSCSSGFREMQVIRSDLTEFSAVNYGSFSPSMFNE